MPKNKSTESKNKAKSQKMTKLSARKPVTKVALKATVKSTWPAKPAAVPVGKQVKGDQIFLPKSKVETGTVESYFNEMGVEYHTLAKGMWMVSGGGVPNVIVSFEPPVVVVRLKLMETGDIADHFGLYKRLLELNSEQMIAGAFGLEGENIVAVEVLQSENLDLNELQAAIEGITLTAMQNYRELKEYRSKETAENAVHTRTIKGGAGYHDDPGFVF